MKAKKSVSAIFWLLLVGILLVSSMSVGVFLSTEDKNGVRSRVESEPQYLSDLPWTKLNVSLQEERNLGSKESRIDRSNRYLERNNPEQIIFQDDFESYSVGDFPSSGGWEIVYNGAGDQYQKVVDTTAAEGSKSFQALGQSGWSAVIRKPFKSSSTIFGYECYIQFGTDGAGAISFYNQSAASWGARYATIIANDTGGIHLVEGGKSTGSEKNYELGTYTLGVWYKIKVILNRVDNTADIWIDGTKVGNDLQLTYDPYEINSFRLASAHEGYRAYFDNITVVEGESIYSVPSAPETLQATAGEGQVSLDWDPPADDGGSSITEYKIFRGTSSGSLSYYDSVGGSTTQYTDTSVTNGQIYYYQVSAVNDVGEGPKSGEASATPKGVPMAPRNLQATAGDGQVSLDWGPPADDGGSSITDYKIYRGISSGSLSYYDSVGGSTTQYTDTSVTNGQTYYYQVNAVNSAGEGDKSGEVNTVPNSGDRPYVEWVEPTDGAGDVDLECSISITFNMPMNEDSLAGQNVTLVDVGNQAEVTTTKSYDPATYTLTMTPDSPMNSDSMYAVSLLCYATPTGQPGTIVMSGVQGANGEYLEPMGYYTYQQTYDIYIWESRFWTEGLNVLSTDPVDGDTGLEVDFGDASLTFNHTLDPATVDDTSVFVEDPSGGDVGITPTASGDTITVAFDDALAYGETYTVHVTTAVTDDIGLALPEEFTFSFSTKAEFLNVAATDPVDGEEDVPKDAVIEVGFNKALNTIDISYHLSLAYASNGSAVAATLTPTSSDTVVEIEPENMLLWSTEYEVTISGDLTAADGSPFDSDGLLANGADESDYTFSFTTEHKPTTLESSTPEENALGVAVDASIQLTFTVGLNESTVDNNTITLTSGVNEVDINVTSSGDTVTIDSMGNLSHETTYIVTINGDIEDVNDNMFDGNGDGNGEDPYSFSFTTVEFPLNISTVYPEDGEVDVTITTDIYLEFNKAVNESTLNESIELNGEVLSSDNYTYDNDSKRVTIEVGDLEHSKLYAITVDSAVASATSVDNTLGESFSWSFETEEEPVTAPDPSTETPTNASISVSIDSVSYDVNELPNKSDISVLIQGTTGGVDHCEICFVNYYDDGTHDEEVYWMEEFDYSDSPYMDDFSVYHFKSTSENWKTWEYKMEGTVDSSEDGTPDDTEDNKTMTKSIIYVRAYADAEENNWNQDSYTIYPSEAGDGDGGDGEEDKDNGTEEEDSKHGEEGIEAYIGWIVTVLIIVIVLFVILGLRIWKKDSSIRNTTSREREEDVTTPGSESNLNSELTGTDSRWGSSEQQVMDLNDQRSNQPVGSNQAPLPICQICMGKIKTEGDKFRCPNCGIYYHSACTKRLGVCPECGEEW